MLPGTGGMPVSGMGGVPSAGSAGAGEAGSTAPSCESTGESSAVGVASATLQAPSLRLDESATLLGPGVQPILMAQENVTSGLRWQNDRLFILADPGFWEVSIGTPGTWNVTPTILVLGIRAGDLDRDGDQDVMLLTTQIQTTPGADGMPGGIVTRLAVWERTPEGLTERSEVMQTQHILLPMPFVFGDLDGDADLDIVTYERGEPIGYVHDGAFEFSRMSFGNVAPEYMSSIVTAVAFEDRNGDGAEDLLVIAGEALELNGFVLLRGADGKFLPPGEPTPAPSPLVPHGPTGTGVGIADVTGDGLADIVEQDPQSAVTPILRVLASTDAKTIAPPLDVDGLGFEFADVDEDGKLDILTTKNDRLVALLSRGNGAFEPRDLGLDVRAPAVKDFVADPGDGVAPARLHVLYHLPCKPCGATCSGRCIFGTCVTCLSDADCAGGRCQEQVCVP